MATQKETMILDAYGVSSEEETKQITENAAKIHALNEMMKQDGADKKALRAQVHELIHENEQLLGLPWYEQTHYNVLAKLAAWVGRRVMYVFSPSYRAAVQFGLHNAMQDKIPNAPLTEVTQKAEKSEPKNTKEKEKTPKETVKEQTIDPSMFIPFDTAVKDQKTNESPQIDDDSEQQMAELQKHREKLEKMMPAAEKKLYGELRPDRPKEEKDRIFAEAMLMSHYEFADLSEATPTVVEYLIRKETERLQAQNRVGEGKEDKYAVHDAYLNVLKKHEYILNTIVSHRDQEVIQNLVKEITAPLQDKTTTKGLDPLLYTIGEATAAKPEALQDLSYDILNYHGYLLNISKDQEKAFMKGFTQEIQYRAKALVKADVKKMPEEERAALTTDDIKKMEQKQVTTLEAKMGQLFKEANMTLPPSLEIELSNAAAKETPVKTEAKKDAPVQEDAAQAKAQEQAAPIKTESAKEAPKQPEQQPMQFMDFQNQAASNTIPQQQDHPERDNINPAAMQAFNQTEEYEYEDEDNGVPFDYHDPAEYEQEMAYDDYEADMDNTHAMSAAAQEQQNQPAQSMLADFDAEVAKTVREFLSQPQNAQEHTEMVHKENTKER